MFNKSAKSTFAAPWTSLVGLFNIRPADFGRIRPKKGRRSAQRSLGFESLEGRTMMSAAPLAPALHQISALSTTGVQVAWADVASATGYRLEYRIDGTAAWQQGGTAGASASTGTISNLSPGVRYDFAVQAFNSSGNSSLSNQIILAMPAPPTSAPASVNATFNMTANQINVGWNAVAGATSYTVYRGTVNNPNSAVSVVSVGAGTNSFVDTSPVPGTQYFYWVKASNGSATSSFSNFAGCLDTDRVSVTTTAFDVTPVLKTADFLQSVHDDLNDLLAWDPTFKGSISVKLDSLSAVATKQVIVTPSGQLVSGTCQITVNESGEVTAQVSGGIGKLVISGVNVGVSAQFGVTVFESLSLRLTQTYSASSHNWTVNPAATSVTGSVSASASGTVTVLGAQTGVILRTPGANFSATGSGQVTVAPHISVSFGCIVLGSERTLWQSPTVALAPLRFNLSTLAIP